MLRYYRPEGQFGRGLGGPAFHLKGYAASTQIYRGRRNEIIETGRCQI